MYRTVSVQLIRAKSTFTFNETEAMEEFISMDLRRKFRLAELDQAIHQDNGIFVNLINKIPVNKADKNAEYIIKINQER